VKEASFWHQSDGSVECELCPHECRIGEGKRGICRVRENRGGRLYALTYGRPVSLAVDPVEKKPLFHVHPGSTIYSVGLAGCNLKCSFCQNYDISQADPEDLRTYEAPPERIVRNAKDSGCMGIAFTYNEPAISIEYSMDTFRMAQKEGLYTCYVTNGYINPEPARRLGECLDCANVDFKSSQGEFYRKLCKAPDIDAVKETIRIWKEAGVWVEITTLLIPGHNDSREAVEGVIDFVLELGADTPLHFSRFHPTYMLTDVEPTPSATIEMAVARARERGLHYVYSGNTPGSKWESTYCPGCGSVVIERFGYRLGRIQLDEANACLKCGERIALLGRPSKANWLGLG
jgi:pyruvate formate lyase activating enzyme